MKFQDQIMERKETTMKKLLLFLIFMLAASPLYGASFTINYPDADTPRIVEGLTDDGGNCLEGEGVGVCAKRQIVQLIKQKIRQYETQKAKNQAAQGVSDADIS